MANSSSPFISAEQKLPEITVKVVILSIILAIILAVANTYLALKIGLLTSASIPAAVISMGILRFFKNATILENNLVQTAASAGEAVAGGIVYTVPALIIIGYWHQFSYWQNVWIALLGGCIGVMFSIPLRRFLMTEPNLRFPEGRAVAEILKAHAMGTTGFLQLVIGGGVGAMVELAQTGFKILASSWQHWFGFQRTIVGFGFGFSPAMIGAGFLMGGELAMSLLIGAIINWGCVLPLIGHFYPALISKDATASMQAIWQNKAIFVGIGALMCAGVWTLLAKSPAFIESIRVTFNKMSLAKDQQIIRTERDIPFVQVCGITLLLSVGIFAYVQYYFPLVSLGLSAMSTQMVVIAILAYVLIIGFISSAITAYFSGMVGVTATPGSAIVIGGMTLAALGLLLILKFNHSSADPQALKAAAAMAILIGAFITGAAAISNDNMQDLKVGHLLGATPWKQQVMLLLGVLVASLVIPPVMQLLFNVYGIANVLPHAGMNPTETLPAPPAAVMAALTQAVFAGGLPWNMVMTGIALMATCITLTQFRACSKLSVLGIAIGMYLPLASSMPIIIGGVISYCVKRRSTNADSHHGALIACGLVAGAALMDVLLAVPFSYYHNPDVWSLTTISWEPIATLLSIIVTLIIARWFIAVSRNEIK